MRLSGRKIVSRWPAMPMFPRLAGQRRVLDVARAAVERSVVAASSTVAFIWTVGASRRATQAPREGTATTFPEVPLAPASPGSDFPSGTVCVIVSGGGIGIRLVYSASTMTHTTQVASAVPTHTRHHSTT
jgi:hypothetical protein